MKKILIDIEKCYSCRECTAKCSYPYHHSEMLKIPYVNTGVEKFLSKGAQYVVCRRCENPFCVNSCPNDALGKDEKGILHRYLMKCTSCKNCSIGCPFGVIHHEILPYKTSQCDYCTLRCNGNDPLCVQTCTPKALLFIDINDAPDKNIYVLNEHLAVYAIPWNKEAKVGVPK